MVDTEFIEALASKAPTPGGGGASAYAGALASALASMVGNLTVGKKKYADVEERMQAELVELADTREHLLALIDEDARAFGPLAAAYGMPKGSDEETAVAGIDALAAFIKEIGLPTSFAELGIPADTDFRAIADSTNVTAGCCKKLTHDEIYEILQECL